MTDLVKIIGMDDGWEIVPKTGEFKPSKLPVGLWVKELKKLKIYFQYEGRLLLQHFQSLCFLYHHDQKLL